MFRGFDVYCPYCKEKAMKFFEFVFINPFKQFECRSCNTMLKTSLCVKIFCIVAFCAVAISFYFTFPIMYDYIHSHPNQMIRWILGIMVPFIAIVFQVSVIFIPVALYTWKWGKLEVVSLKDQGI